MCLYFLAAKLSIWLNQNTLCLNTGRITIDNSVSLPALIIYCFGNRCVICKFYHSSMYFRSMMKLLNGVKHSADPYGAALYYYD